MNSIVHWRIKNNEWKKSRNEIVINDVMMVDEIGNHRLKSNKTVCVCVVISEYWMAERIQFHEIDTRPKRSAQSENGQWELGGNESPSSR